MDETQGSCWKVKHLVIWTQTFNMTNPCQVKRKWKLVIVAEIVQDSSTRTWNRRGEKIGSEESSIRTWNRREKFTGSEDLSTRSGNRREKSIGSEESSTRTRNRRPGPRICRPGVEIVDQDREFIDRVRGIVDQDDEWSMKIYRVRGMVDQGLKSSTRSETSSTGSEDSSTRTAGCPRKKNVAE